jgi:hypothetical protein
MQAAVDDGAAAPAPAAAPALAATAEQVERLQQLRTARVSKSTRRSYASGAVALLGWWWENRPQLLARGWSSQFERAGGGDAGADAGGLGAAPSAKVIKATLPGYRADGALGPAPLEWGAVTAGDFMAWMLELRRAGTLKKGNMGTKRSALYNMYMDFGKKDVYDANLNDELTALGKGMARELAQSMRDGESAAEECYFAHSSSQSTNCHVHTFNRSQRPSLQH